MSNDNQKIDYRKFFSLSFLFVYSQLSNFNTNDTGHSSEAGSHDSLTASYQGLVQEIKENVWAALLAAMNAAGCPTDGIINTIVL